MRTIIRAVDGFCFLICVLFTASAPAAYPDGYSQDFINSMNWSMGTGAPDYTPHAAGMVNNLKTLTPSTPGLIWKPGDPSRVLLSTFADYDGYHQGYTDGGRRNVLWLAPAPDLYNFLRDNNISGTDAALRTKQLLGMPADHTGDRVVEVYASVNGMRWPMKNPDVTNPNSSIEFPADVDVNYPGFRAWFEANKSTYTANPPYPWTQLGYTCDWGKPDSYVGMTEFILPLPTEAKFMVDFYAVYSIGSYQYVDRNTGNFNITGDCDTVWAGTYFQPFNSGNAVIVGAGATVHQGIEISSGGYTVSNYGTILGPGKNLDKTYRASVLKFDAGGTLVNTGIIDGLVGVEGASDNHLITNTGLIRGTQCAIRTGSGVDQINNSGQIDGNIETGGGGDTVTLQGGTVNGNIIDGTVTSTANSITISNGVAGNFIVNAAGQTATVNGNIQNFASNTIQSGTATINGQIYGDTTVQNAGILAGNPTIMGGNLNNQGTVSPGNSIGLVTVNGNYTQQSGATLAVELSKPMDGLMVCDRLDATGTVTLAAGSLIDVSHAQGNNAVFRNGDRFNIITAGGSITNQGVQVTTHSSFLTFTTYNWTGPNIFGLRVAKSITFASVVPDGNAKYLAVALDSDGDIAIDSFANVVNELLFMNSAEFAAAVPGLSPAAYHAVNSSSRRTTQYLAESMSDYLQSRRYGGGRGFASQQAYVTRLPMVGDSLASDGNDLDNFPITRSLEQYELPAVVRNQQPDDLRQIIARPFGLFFDEQGSADRVGFHAGSAGVLMALDRVATDDFIYGWGVAYARTSIRFTDAQGTGDMNNIRVGPYLSRSFDDWFLDGSATYGYHDDDVIRNVTAGAISGAPTGRYNGHDFSLFMAASCDRNFGAYIVTPSVSLQGIYYRQCAFTETGGNGADLALPNNDSYSLRSKLGAQFYRVLQIRSVRLIPEYSLGWAHEYLGDNSIAARFAGGTTIFDTDPAGVLRDSMYFGAGVAFLPTKHTSLFCRYNGEWAANGQFNAVNLGLAWEY